MPSPTLLRRCCRRITGRSFPRSPNARDLGHPPPRVPPRNQPTSEWERPCPALPRHEGGLLSRALGTAVHTLLEELARLRNRLDWQAARSALQQFEPRIAAQVRATGVDQPQAAQIAAEALQLALKASHDPSARGFYRPMPTAASEAAWAGVVAGDLRSVRVDRVFRAGPTPGAEGNDCWWIIDYKTTHAGNLDPEQALPRLRQLFAPQLEAYAGILRNLHGGDAPLFAGLYYPRWRCWIGGSSSQFGGALPGF
jgi:ATP-dependent helicase/nuclease subunit A